MKTLGDTYCEELDCSKCKFRIKQNGKMRCLFSARLTFRELINLANKVDLEQKIETRYEEGE